MPRSGVLGWYQFPEPEGRGYREEDLRDPALVEELFDYCQILYAVISKKLFSIYPTTQECDIIVGQKGVETDEKKLSK